LEVTRVSQWVPGPDSALAPIIAASVVPLAAGDPDPAVALAGLLALMMGGLLLLGGILRLGLVTNLMSKPIRLGYLNGIALVAIVGFGKVWGRTGGIIVIAVALSLVAVVNQTWRPYRAELGRRRGDSSGHRVGDRRDEGPGQRTISNGEVSAIGSARSVSLRRWVPPSTASPASSATTSADRQIASERVGGVAQDTVDV
jgi:MFS superfamily sulfate permease-like transporter